LTWTADGKNILESGSTTLILSSGGSLRQVWSSTTTPEHGLGKFPSSGQEIAINISPFEIDGDRMSFNWEGTVKER
jgi:hypothetical protein